MFFYICICVHLVLSILILYVYICLYVLQHATVLLEAVLEKRNWSLARDVVRHLKAIGRSNILIPVQHAAYKFQRLLLFTVMPLFLYATSVPPAHLLSLPLLPVK